VVNVECRQKKVAELRRIQPFEPGALQRTIVEVEPIDIDVGFHEACKKAEAAPKDAASQPAAEETGGMRNSERNVVNQRLRVNSDSCGNYRRKQYS